MARWERVRHAHQFASDQIWRLPLAARLLVVLPLWGPTLWAFALATGTRHPVVYALYTLLGLAVSIGPVLWRERRTNRDQRRRADRSGSSEHAPDESPPAEVGFRAEPRPVLERIGLIAMVVIGVYAALSPVIDAVNSTAWWLLALPGSVGCGAWTVASVIAESASE